MLDARLEIRVYDDYNKATLLDDLTDRVDGLSLTTALHGGFKECRLRIPMDLGQSWLWLHRGGLRGYHFRHLEINEEQRTIWEGRIMSVSLVREVGFRGADVLALGYWSSCRDQLYDPADGGNTDWTAGGPHTVDDVIKEMLNDECPDINTDQSNITAPTSNIVGLDLTARDYPMNNIVDKLAPLVDSGDSPWYFAIWDDRKPYWKERAIADPVDWFVYLADIPSLRLEQSGLTLRNKILPVVGSTEGTAASNAASQALYPVREAKLNLPSGISGTVENQARDVALTERKEPVQNTGFTIQGKIYTGKFGDASVSGALVEAPLWRVRAGDTIRIQDLVPVGVTTPSFDALRTFYILETSYDHGAQTLTIQPDRPGSSLAAILARLNTIERDKSLG